ncbi:CoA transferase [Mesorhizobium microcysteis]|uniref:CoA transferase n=1 Tax=Neoaquamicrobium microcysteis TaxID=2682781 RepID=A0A5D4H140_9HYPH|nr:CaiB/BaiF CoA-transferase family protein [Mesorhizobium microcysteis]TYR33235.1 CoA transferase [Mesorhizobium microcysteis]
MLLPLEGILVVAIEQAVAAPTCTLRLADAGARVIKIERAEGETARHYDQAVHGTSAYFAWLNRGKESAVLDIKNEGDRALVERMVSKADIFVQNLAPGAASRLGLGAKDLVERFPRIVAVDIVGYRQDSSFRDMRAYDMLIQAESGICAVTGTPDTPVKVGVSLADVQTGMNAHAAILEALIERGVTGRGKAIEIAMFDAMADMMSVPLLHHLYGGRATPRTGLAHAAIFPYGRVSCSDGDIVIVVQNPGEWRRLCEGVMQRPDLVADQRFADNPSRVNNREMLGDILAGIFGGITRVEAVTRLEANALAWSSVSTVEDLARHPALARLALEVPGGVFEGVASPVRRHVRAGAVPALGQHTDAVRIEFEEKKT